MEPLKIKLLNNKGEYVPAVLRELIPAKDLDPVERLWKPMLAETKQQDRDWDWKAKFKAQRAVVFEHYAVECKEELQGLMFIDIGSGHPRDNRSLNLVYVAWLAVAPWNRKEVVKSPKFRLTGSHLLRWAVVRSAQLGFKHRIGLHALAQAEKFYREKARMKDFGADAEVQDLHYFEFDESAGRKFKEGF